jgi:hypothetical protein
MQNSDYKGQFAELKDVETVSALASKCLYFCNLTSDF